MSKHIIVFSTVYFPIVGGAEVAMKEITDRLPDWSFELVCARIRPGLLATERIGRITVHRCGVGKPIDKYLLPITGTWRALCLARKHDVSVIWSLMASFGGVAALMFTYLRPKTIMLLTLQEGHPLDYYAKRFGLFTRFHPLIFKRANAVQAISRFLADWGVRMGFTGVSEVVPNGVDVTHFEKPLTREERKRLRTEMGYTDEDIVLITTSRLTLKNGVDDLIRSLSSLPEKYKSLIVGEGEDKEKLSVLVQKKRLESRVLFFGSRGHDQLPSLLHASDIFVRASLSEGLGCSFLEAMASGIPIVGTPVGGIPDFLTDGETGVFCQPRDPESLAKAVRRIQEESGLRPKLIKQGKELVVKDYTWDGIAQKMEKILEGLNHG